MPKFTKIDDDPSVLYLAENESTIDNYYVEYMILIVGGSGDGEFRFIRNYEGLTKKATLYHTFDSALDDTSIYALLCGTVNKWVRAQT